MTNHCVTVSLTRLRLRSVRFLPGFVWYAHGSRQSMRRQGGFIAGQLLADEHLVFWTLTLWTDQDSMKQWRGAGAHGASMPRLKHWCDEASVARWTVPETTPLPDWSMCHARMIAEGRLSPVLYPSAAQQAGLHAIAAPTRRPSSVPIHPVRR